MKNLQNAEAVQLTPHQKRQLSTKQFLKMKRKLQRQEKNNESSFEQLKQLITSSQAAQFHKEILNMNPQLVLNFLFSQDQLKNTPYLDILQHKNPYSFIEAINEWAFKNSEFLEKQLEVESNQIKIFDWHNAYSKINKVIASRFSQPDQDTKGLIQLLGKKNSIYFRLSKIHLTMELITIFINKFPHPEKIIHDFYLPLLTHSDLCTQQYLKKQLEQILMIMQRDELWKNLNFVKMIRDNKIQNFDLLELRHLDYNFFHQLAVQEPMMFMEACDLIKQGGLEDDLLNRLEGFMMQIDRSGETPLDKILRSWKCSQIQILLNKYSDLKCLVLTTSCLNKILQNRKLGQHEKEQLIKKCLSGKISQNGYAKILREKVEVKLGKSKSKLYSSSIDMNEIKLKEVQTMKHTYTLCFSKDLLKMEYSSSSDLYPLACYLNMYKERADLQVIDALWLTSLNKKDIKKRILLFQIDQKEGKYSLSPSHNYYKQFEILYLYYQPLWKIMTFLKHGDVLEHLINKCYLNVSQIKVDRLRKDSDHKIDFFGPHFLKYYLMNNSNLSENSINKAIIEATLNCKEKEKQFHKFNLTKHLIISLAEVEVFHSSQDWVPTTLRNNLKTYFESDKEVEEYLTAQELYDGFSLLQFIFNPLVQGKIKNSSLISLENMIKKITKKEIIEHIERQLPFDSPKVARRTQNLFKSMLKRIGEPYDEMSSERKLFLQNIKNQLLSEYQNKYSNLFNPECLNQQFFSGITSKNDYNLYFRLKTKQFHLEYKMKALLSQRFDVYFSKYDKQPNISKEGDKTWVNLIIDMWKNKTSLLNTILTDQNITFDNFKQIFKKSIQNAEQYQQSKFFLCKMALEIKSQKYFISPPKKPWNMKFILDLLKFTNQQNENSFQIADILERFFLSNINTFLLDISKIQTSPKTKKESPLIKAAQKKKQLEQYFNRWIPQITKAGKDKQQNEKIFKKVIQPLLQSCQKRRLTSMFQGLLKNVQLHHIFLKKYSLAKIAITPDADILVSKQISALEDDDFEIWLKLFSSDSVRPQLVKTYSKFTTQGLQNISIEISKRYQAENKKSEPDARNLNSMINMITLCFRLISADKKIQTLIKLKQFTLVDKALANHYRSMLMKVDKINTSTAALIFLDASLQLVFYLKDKELKQYSNLNFYHKCSDEAYDIYIENLKKFYKYSPSLSKHLKTVCSSLVESQNWSRLLTLYKIQAVQRNITEILLIDLHLTSNRKLKMSNKIVKQIVSTIFNCYQQHNIKWNDQFFLAAYDLDHQKALQVMKPQQLSFRNVKKCILLHPEGASALLKIELSKDSAPQNYFQWRKFSMPFINHYIYNYSKQPYLIDEIRLENKMLKQGKASEQNMKGMKKTWRSHPSMLPHWQQFIGQKQNMGALVSQDILNNRSIKSLNEYEKTVPNLKISIKDYLMSGERVKCKNLQNINENIMQIIIDEMLTDDKQILFCILLRLLDRAEIKFIDLFLNKCNITLSYEYLKQFDDYFNKNQKISQGVQESFSILKHLFAIKNQHFVMEFIKKFKIFEIYPIEEYSPTLLTVCCTYRLNQLLHFTIEHIEKKYKVKTIFAADDDSLGPRITNTGSFFMPVQTAIDFNFYECYFLIKGSNNQCPNFKLSGRFISQVDPEPWRYIPQFQRRIKINNSLMKSLKESLDLNFRRKVVLPSVFQLEAPPKEPRKRIPKNRWQGDDAPPRYRKQNSYRKALSQFINSVVTGHFAEPNPQMGILQRLSLLVVYENQTLIPSEELRKRHTSQMYVVDNLKEFFIKKSDKFDVIALLENFPEYQPLYMTYNPGAFFKQPRLLNRIANLENDDVNKINYLKAIQVNLNTFTTQHIQVLKSFINKQLYPFDKTSISQQSFNSSIKRQLLLMIILELNISQRNVQSCSLYQLITEHEATYFSIAQQEGQQDAKYKDIWTNKNCKEQALSQLVAHLNPREGVFDLMFWNKIIESVENILKHRQTLKMDPLASYSQEKQELMLNSYSQILKKEIGRANEALQVLNEQDIKLFLVEILNTQQKNYKSQGIYLQCSLLMNSQLLIRQLQSLRESVRQSFKKVQKIKIKLTFQGNNNCKCIEQNSLQFEIGYTIENIKNTIALGQLNLCTLLESLRSEKVSQNLKNNTQIQPLNTFFAKDERHPFFKGYSFQIQAESFSKIKNLRILQGIFDNRSLSSNNIIAKVIGDVEKMEEELYGARNIKLYNMSDIFGPINFNEQTDKNRIIDCLTFYELLALPKDKPIKIIFRQKHEETSSRNQRMYDYLTKYFEYYINSAREDNPQQIEISQQLTIFLEDNHKEDESYKKVIVNWDLLGAWTISSLTASILHYCSELSNKIEQILDVRVSFLSILKYYQQSLKSGQEKSLEHNTEELLFGKSFSTLVQSILLMITEDIRNIMSIVKGIIITLGVNEDIKAVGNVILSETTSATAVDYEVKQSLLYIKFHLKVKTGLNKKGSQGDQVEKLVSRKDFLDTVFVSPQFLTDYFIHRNELNRQCLNISTSISKKLNSTHHFHIDYKNLYTYMDAMRKKQSIKDIDSFLSGLKHYLQNNMERTINLYLSSQDLANKHQILLMNKCQAINKNVELEDVEKACELTYDIEQNQNQNGLKQIAKIMNDIGNDENTKSTFLIQIYKSHYSTLVAEGMTFVVGYQSSQKRTQVVSIKKAENINEINIVEVDYLLLVSKTIPTTDELNPQKIIRIFVTDFNRNLYRLNSRLSAHFLGLPADSEDRHISHFAPILPPDLKLVFNMPKQASEKDTKQTKIFCVNLPPLTEQLKPKLKPSEDRALTPINTLKRSVEFKQAITTLSSHLKSSLRQKFTIVIDPPQESDQNTANANFDHLLSLVTSDIIDTVNKFQYDSMRNSKLDCKLSVQKQMILNQSAIIQLRKKNLLDNFSGIRIKLRQGVSKVIFEGKQIIIQISYTDTKVLPSSSEYLTAILEDLIKKQSSKLPKNILLESKIEEESTQLLLKLFDTLNVLKYQLQQIQTAKKLIKALGKKQIEDYKIIIGRKKADILIDKTVNLSFNLETVERQFYTAQDIVFSYLKTKNPEASLNQNAHSEFIPETKCIVTRNSPGKHKLYAFINGNLEFIDANQEVTEEKSSMSLSITIQEGTKFFIIDEFCSISSNYFFSYNDSFSVVKSKQHEAFIGRSSSLYLHSDKKINLNFSNISVTKKDLFNKQNTSNESICHQNLRNTFIVQLISNNVYNITIKSEESAHFVVHFAGNNNPFHVGQTANILISSDSQMDLNCTKFIQLEIFKKKPVLIKEKEKTNTNSDFRQTSQMATAQVFKVKQQDSKNIENLVYVINDDCKKFLTRAGEPRTDFIQLCDGNHNPVNYTKDFDVKFVHINRLAIVEPEIIKRGMQFGFKWTPTVRGHYYLYINQCLLNPTYEIGVCAAQADHLTSKVTGPKVTKICFCQESEIMLDLRDSYGNIYSQLEEQIIGDQLLIDLQPDKLAPYLKKDKTQINKYGVKKVKFNFNYTEGQQNIGVDMNILLNRQQVLNFQLQIQGYSLKQRKKLLENDINAKDKKFHKSINIHRGRFLEQLMNLAEKSLHVNLNIKFVNQPGIDAGGLKRQFYDMVGNEMKNQKNPFFLQVNKDRIEYFLNPQILRNKKKCEYMEMWGKYLANAILNSYLIGMNFSPVFIKMLYESEIDYEDMLEVLPDDESKQYKFLLTAPPEAFEDLCLFFTVVVDKKKSIEVQLKEGGKDIQVTAQNVKEYLELTSHTLLTKRYKDIFEAFRQGFDSVIELQIIRKWIRPQEFWCLTAGTKQITAQMVLNYINFSGSHIENISGWFRRYINEANRDILLGFLKFTSGSSSIDFNLTSKLTVTFENAGENPKKLPISHTCWKEIVVPKYKNYEIMKKLLNAAFIYCCEGFGFG